MNKVEYLKQKIVKAIQEYDGGRSTICERLFNTDQVLTSEGSPLLRDIYRTVHADRCKAEFWLAMDELEDEGTVFRFRGHRNRQCVDLDKLW